MNCNGELLVRGSDGAVRHAAAYFDFGEHEIERAEWGRNAIVNGTYAMIHVPTRFQAE